MFVRLALIAAIIVCPLLCRNGHCQKCCAIQPAEPAQAPQDSTCFSSGTEGCCCPSPSDDRSDPKDSGRVPCDEDSDCQGVCGGAVLEKPNSRAATADSLLLNEFDAIVAPRSRLGDRHLPVVVLPFSGGMPPGRYLRTLHMSFLL